MRDENLALLPGVELGDIGTKVGDNNVDIGYLRLKGVRIPRRHVMEKRQVILTPAPGVSNEGPRSRVLVPLPAVSWPWVPAWGSLEPPRRDGENAQKRRGKNGRDTA